MTATRRLAAILAADVAGYSRLIGADEEGTLNRLKAIRAEVIDPKVSEHRGRIVKTTGDGLLVEFASVIDALRCAIEWQTGMTEQKTETSDRRIEFRIGINIGDVVVEDGDIFGDGVNVAARLEALAEPGGICLSGTVRDHIGDRLGLAFDDLGDQSLKNIARPIRVFRVRVAEAATAALIKPAPPALALPDKPSIAVLPFENMSGDPEQEYFVDGMVEEIITALSRIRWLFVIARNSSFTYKGKTVDVKQVGRELGVRYVLEGSVRKGGDRVRITGQLIEAETGVHLWADRFDGSLENVFDIQDKVASSVAGVIEPALQAAETARSVRHPTRDLNAYDAYLRAYEMHMQSAKRIPEALDLLQQAIHDDPEYGPALAWASVCCVRLVSDGLSKDPAMHRSQGLEFARRALQVARDDPSVCAHAAIALSFFGDDTSAVLALVDRALSLNPSYARGWYVSGMMRLWAGDPDTAAAHAEISLRLDPRGGVASMVIGGALFIRERYDEALPYLLSAVQDHPDFPLPYRILAACYARSGQLQKAREVIERIRAISTAVLPPMGPWRDAKHQELFLSGLRLAMGEVA